MGFYLIKKMTRHAGGRAGPGWARIWLCWARCAVLGRGIWPCWAGLGVGFGSGGRAGLGWARLLWVYFDLIDLLALFGVYAGIIYFLKNCFVGMLLVVLTLDLLLLGAPVPKHQSCIKEHLLTCPGTCFISSFLCQESPLRFKRISTPNNAASRRPTASNSKAASRNLVPLSTCKQDTF